MFSILSAAVAPGFALLAFIYLKDRFDPEPFSLVFKTFILGALLVFPLMFIQYAFGEEGLLQSPFLHSFVLSAGLEEFFKWFIFLFFVYKHTEFNGHYDGIVYGVSISLGFATLENILYLFAKGISFAFIRALFPVSSHALIGVLMGYYMGRAKYGTNTSKNKMIAVALCIPIIVHGSYDFVLEVWEGTWVFIMIPFMLVLWYLALRKIKLANHIESKVQRNVIPIHHKKTSV
ncbi:glutamic-type intramembrane protease PrsW [Pontibacillus litoralis]|uniref:Protease PrsW n=1 Tax=Pontibacillus litoralis JSM 072002 TaxID=1385512 RepID=A0A0A5G4G4_9BACI|nr:glutamic-type intramembrane protease PrsW [Pontibacillus litoralis]KGX87986.1 protease [Pontibacillus litoralis JSM 072002]